MADLPTNEYSTFNCHFRVTYQFSNGEVQIGEGDFTFFVKSGFLIENGQQRDYASGCG